VTLASGRTLDFSRIYLVATSNLGSREILEREHLPFTSLESHIVQCLEQWLRPELLARFETAFVFRPLDWETQKEVTAKRLEELVAWQRKQHQRDVRYDAAVVEHLIAAGFSRRYGARPLLRTIDRLMGNAMVRALRADNSGDGLLCVDGEALRLIPE
jgi:ATP-dependent Clp protease ATP-binding subunit ClpA